MIQEALKSKDDGSMDGHYHHRKMTTTKATTTERRPPVINAPKGDGKREGRLQAEQASNGRRRIHC